MYRLLVATALSLVSLNVNSVSADVLLRVRPHVVVAPELDVTLEQLVDAENLSAASHAKMKQLTISIRDAKDELLRLAVETAKKYGTKQGR